MTAQPANFSAFIDAARDSVAREIATLRREAERERDLREAEYRARMAELDSRIMSVNDIERQLAGRLSTLKDGEPGKSVTVDEVAPLIAEHVERAVGAMAKPENGKDADPEVIRSIVQDVVSALPPAEAGRDADPAIIAQMVTEAVMALPPAQDGKDADIDAVASLVREQVDNAVAALPVPKDWITLDELSLVDARVQEFASIFSGNLDEIRASMPSNMEFVPAEVAESVASAIRLMAETPQTHAELEFNQPIPTVNIALSDNRLPPVVNVSLPRPGAERVQVTEHSEDGRIKSYIKTPIDEA